MIEKILFTANAAVSPDQTSAGKIFSQWAEAGMFSYVLPFLLIFALIFGILSKTKLFGEESKKINAIIALIVGLLAIQFNFVSDFFGLVFPKVGVGIAIILIAIVVAGFFLEEKQKGFLLIVGIVVFVIIAITTAMSYGFDKTFNFSESLPMMLLVAIVLWAIYSLVRTKESKKEKKPEKDSSEKKGE